MPLSRLLPVAFLFTIGCQDYGFSSTEDPNQPDIPENPDPDPDSDTTPVDEDCEDQTIAGFGAPMNEDCIAEVETGRFDPIVEWTKPNWSVATTSDWIMSHPIVVQLTDDNTDGRIDQDDVPDIVVVTFMGAGTYLRAVSGDGGRELWSTPTSLQMTTGPAAADIDNDGKVEIVALTSGGIQAFEHTGELKWTRSNLSGHISGTSDVASITDMDGDGRVEIIAGRAILNGNGELIGAGSYGMGGVAAFGNVGTASFAVDLDGDGQQEVVVGNAVYRKDGSTVWANGEGDGYPAVADFDGDGDGEIVVSGGGQLRMQDTDGRVLWNQAIPGAANAYYGGPPTVADFDGDGEPEIGVAAGSKYSVFEADGRVLWQATTDDSSSGNTGSTVFDFEGDGVAEVIYADQTALWVFNGIDGRVKLEFTRHSNGTWLEYPVVADVDGDGHAEIIVVHTPQNGSYTGFTVIGDRGDTWQPAATLWNQHAFHITNVAADGSIPRVPARNWLSFNNFRSSDLSANSGRDLPDLRIAKADICEIDCDEGELWVWAHTGNEGMTDVAGARVVVTATANGADRQVADYDVADLAAGEYSEAVQLVLTGEDWSSVDRLTFEIQSADRDCNPDNDVLVIEGPFCP